ncbi:dystonin-like protein short stop isoform X2 [Brevipalpus obovatus]|uniref:dystonin-like protein short stop isoform X2 n=1 Tax=Brevipalpus obovatus TaxID=246614 RepID=UPI003D9F3EF4
MSYVNFYAHHQYHPHQRRASIVTTVSTSSSPPSTPTSFTRPSSSVSTESVLGWYQSSGIHSLDDLHDRNYDLVEWARSKPLSILQLDPADRAVLKIADERDGIQKKTFTKWINRHLVKHQGGRRVVDLYEDLRDGENLISLLEVLAQEIIPRERGRMRVHMLQNVQNALDYLKSRRIKLVNIRPDDIVDSNQKLTLGLIWTIILHYQISDIIQHDESVTFKEALLKWAQKTTEGYPGVKVTDFTNTWKDGLAFNAILHRNRPDLLDYRACGSKTNRENLESAFRIAERDLGVTRLLDPEDVDTKNVDEKSMITYISSLYELFPNPPERNPLLDDEKLRRIEEYKDSSARLLIWIKENTARLNERDWPNTVNEMKQLQHEQERFRTEEIPPKLHEKQRLSHAYKEAVKLAQTMPNVYIDHELSSDNIEILWNRLITAHQERDNAISSEILRLEKMHRLAEKLLREIKNCDIRLDDIERKIAEEEKRVLKLHPLETKFNVEQIEHELKAEEERIKIMFEDVQTLRDGRYHKAAELHNRVQQLYQRWSDLRIDFQTRVLQPLAARREEALRRPITEEELIKTKNEFRFLSECIAWVQEHLKKLNEKDYGHDLASVKSLLEEQKVEHRTINEFQINVDKCTSRKDQFKGQEQEIYIRMLNRLCKGYSELLVLSNKRLSDLDSLLDFMQAATGELKWLTEREEAEIARDWSAKNLNLMQVESHRQNLVHEMEKRESQFNSVMDRGEIQIRQSHPASRFIQEVMTSMQNQWSWLLQLINCFDVHYQHATEYQQFYEDVNEATQWMTKVEDRLNNSYSRQNFTIEEGERLLREMQQLKEEISRYSPVVTDIHLRSKEIVPIKQRRAPLPRPIKARAACMIKQKNVTIVKDETVTLHDNSNRSKWQVRTSGGTEVNAPGVCFVIPPPDQEAIDTAEELKRRYEALIALWTKKQHKLRQNMIFATLKIVKGWDFPTYAAMDPNQRNSIIKALENDIDKLVREGPPDDPGSRRLQDEMKALKDKFAEFDRRMKELENEEALKAQTKKFLETADPLYDILLEKERILQQRVHNPIPRDRETLNSLVSEHKEFDISLHALESKVEKMKQSFHNISKKSTSVQTRHDEIVDLYSRLTSLSALYVERLKAVESALVDMEECNDVISNVEVRLASQDDLPADEVMLRRIHSEMQDSQRDAQRQQSTFDQLTSDVSKVRRIVEKTRPKQGVHSDVNRLEDDTRALTRRWDILTNQLQERIKSLEITLELYHAYRSRMDSERTWMSQINARVNTLMASNKLDVATKIYESLLEHKPSIDDTNVAGERFIREARVYDLSLKNYRDSLEESHPSLDAIIARRSRRNSGADVVEQELDNLNKEYMTLIDTVTKFMETQDFKDFHDCYNILHHWLVAKDKMFSVLGPIACEPRIVATQVQQCNVIRDEFGSQEPTLHRLDKCGDACKDRLEKSSPEYERIDDQVKEIHTHWNQLLSQLSERERNLALVNEVSNEYHQKTAKLQAALQRISDDLDNLDEGGDSAEMLDKLNKLEDDLESQRPLLADCEALCDRLCEMITDTVSKNEVRYKLNALERMYNNLSRKISQRKAELGSSLKEEREFNLSCDAIQDWLREMEKTLAKDFRISALRDVLTRQVNAFEQVYREVLDKEHEVHILLSRGNEMALKIGRKSDSRGLKTKLENIKKQWDKIKKDATDQSTRLQRCMENCRKYHSALDQFLPWLDLCEVKISNLQELSCQRQALEKQIKELQQIKSDIQHHVSDFDNLKNLCDTFLSSVDVDKEDVREEMNKIKKRWDELNKFVLERARALDALLQRLLDFQENARSLGNGLSRLEDRYASHDDRDAARDPKLLDRMKNLLAEVKGLDKLLDATKSSANAAISEAGRNVDTKPIRDEVADLEGRHRSLTQKLQDRCNALDAASAVMAKFHNKLNGIHSNLNSLEEKFESFGPIGREMVILQRQAKEMQDFDESLAREKANLDEASRIASEMISQGYSSDPKGIREQLDQLIRQSNKLQERSRKRSSDIQTMMGKIQQFYDDYNKVDREINATAKDEAAFKPIAREVDTIREQQKEFKSFIRTKVEPLGRRVEDIIRVGNGMIQSAASGVDTSKLEQDVDKLNERWNELKEKLHDRERRLDVALLQAGRFQEALASVEKWLKDTEEMVANQKPPSADYKVVKAQVQEQRFLKKLLLDRQSSMTSLAAMGQELMKNLDAKERAQVERQLENLMSRFEKLMRNANERMNVLESILPVAKEFVERISPLQEWLDVSERRLLSMMTVPTDDSRIKQRIAEHRALHQDIIAHKRDFEELTEVAQHLMSMVGDDEAQMVVDKLKEITDRYAKLVEDSENLAHLLADYNESLVSFVLNFEELRDWIEEMNSRLDRFRLLSVYPDKLREQLDELTEINEEVNDHQKQVAEIVSAGQDLMKHASGEDAIQVKDKLDALNARYNELVHRAADKLRQAQDAFPICDSFHSAHDRLNNWMDEAERALKSLENLSLNVQEVTIQRLEGELPKHKALLEQINHLGPQLGTISPGQGAATIEGMVSRANRRWDTICEQIQRKAERIELSKSRNVELINDIEELLDWFRDAEKQILEAEPIRPNPDFLAMMLKEIKALNEDINSQKARVRDVLSNAKKLMRESPSEDVGMIRDKSEELKDLCNHVSQLCLDRMNILEQALPLAEHFFDAHGELIQWLEEAEGEAEMIGKPAVHASQIRRQQERCKALLQAVAEHKPLVDRLNKSGLALLKLCPESEGIKIRQIMDSDNSRYNALKNLIRDHQNALENALHATSQFVDKLDSMLNALKNIADQLRNAEPIAAHPERIQEQIRDNNAILDDLDKRTNALEAIRIAAKDVIHKAGKTDDPAIKDLKKKLDKMNDLWDEVQTGAKKRGRSLEDALRVAQRFWDQLGSVMKTLRELQDSLNSQEPPAIEPRAIDQQKEALHEIHQDIKQTQPIVESCRQTGKELMQLCGEPDKPEVKKNIEDLDQAWDTVTGLYYKREKNLAEAMEKSMNFHELLRNILAFLDDAEERFARLGPIASDIEAVKKQIDQLNRFKADVDPHMVEIEALNRHAQELMERTTPSQARAVREPLNDINRRWDSLLKGIVDRQNELENALLRLGQFHHSLDEFMAWIEKTDRTLDEMRPTFADAQVLEVELAKHKVLMNDIHAHQTTVDTLNKAGRMLIESDRGSEDANKTVSKLNMLNSRWQQLQNKAAQRQRELEELLREALAFNGEIKDLLTWLADLDGQFSASKPVGGLPETAREQLNRFMELYNELDANRHKVESILQQGNEYVRKSPEGSTPNLQSNLKTLKSRWEAILSRANDRKIKLEIALRDANEFHEALKEFTDWLSSAEKYLANLQPVSLVMDHILPQIEEHKSFQRDVGNHRETMLNLDKKGTHLKYFSQKQDVILIKNLLVSVQHRWERVVAKAAERTRSLDRGYKEAKEFHDAWSSMIKWLTEAEETLDHSQPAGNDPERIKQFLIKHKEFQRTLGAKQATYDATIKLGKSLRSKAPKSDVPILSDMIEELKRRWESACAKSVERQRKLEEALLFSGQFKDAVQALIDWLDKAKSRLGLDNLFGDLDTVTALVEQHKAFQEDLKSRSRNLATVKKTAHDLLETATAADAALIREQLSTLESRWEEVARMSEAKQRRLEEALRQAEELHKQVHQLLEWLSDAEMKLRFAGPLPDDEETTRQQISEHESFMREMSRQETNKDSTIRLANEILGKCHPDAVSVIRHWITIIQSRWDEVSSWAKQREQKLQDHLRSLRNIMEILEELLAWLRKAEADLLAKESEPLPDDIGELEVLIEEHQSFIDEMSAKQDDVEKVAKAFSTSKRAASRQTSDVVKGRRGLKSSTPINGHSKSLDAEIKNPKARELVEKWRSVWLLAMERMRRLQDKLDYLREVERVRNFDFDEWRRRFLGWMNNKKARVMDFFRKIDKDNDGKVTQEEFIEGFLKSKFPTSRLEMERVAPIFDRNSDGYIDHKEYLETLRPERDAPKTEFEIIQDEVQRQVAKCTCVHRYKVFQVGEGKYRFGESQKLRLVRILRSTVMVRVGGGWVSLDEFLIKNDPCRDCLDWELYIPCPRCLPFTGLPFYTEFYHPLTTDAGSKIPVPLFSLIREKTERSVPMFGRNRFGEQTSDYSFTETESGTKSRPRSRMTGGSTGSRPGSRHSSRPPSRASSDLSSESLEGFHQRRDRSTSKTRQTSTLTQSTVSQMRRTPSFGPTNGARWQ